MANFFEAAHGLPPTCWDSRGNYSQTCELSKTVQVWLVPDGRWSSHSPSVQCKQLNPGGAHMMKRFIPLLLVLLVAACGGENAPTRPIRPGGTAVPPATAPTAVPQPTPHHRPNSASTSSASTGGQTTTPPPTSSSPTRFSMTSRR